jgi:starch synthase (maltosyl-transferring)
VPPSRHDIDRSASQRATFSTRRVLVESLRPAVEGSDYALKRVLGDEVRVEADLICDGHEIVTGRVLFRQRGVSSWESVPLVLHANDRFRGSFMVDRLGVWEFVAEGCVDAYATWQSMLDRKLRAGVPEPDLIAHLRQGGTILQAMVARIGEACAAEAVRSAALQLDAAARDVQAALQRATDRGVLALASEYPDFERAGQSHVQTLVVEPTLAQFSAWYEFFPRSCGPSGRHGTFRECEPRLRYAAEMGFDIVYLPPIHPIGTSFRKGKNNSAQCEPDDVGSPWAIGGAEGGHKSIHPELGTLEDFRWFMQRARAEGLRVALDIALQAAPEHPYVASHSEWFAKLPDGTIQYAENPPKKYQDIYPFDFECQAAPVLWHELLDIFLFWANEGVEVFRVDNPHTKSLPFWRYCVAELKQRHPSAILLAEAFTRPKLMCALAKLGFSQSYTYFTWRTTKRELTEYMHELTQTEMVEFFRPNFWPNTPDILPEHLQYGGRAAFQLRLVLATTLSSNYGIYGPAFELMDCSARPGAEEYADNEKYELKRWDVERADSLRPLITRINRVRRENPALHDNRSLVFHETDSEHLLCYSKRRDTNTVLVLVNLDPHHRQSGWVRLDLAALGISSGQTFQVHDQLSEARYLWSGSHNYVELDPAVMPAHVFVLRLRVRSESDFDYFM